MQVEEAARLEATRAEEARRLQRDRRALDAEHRAAAREAAKSEREEVHQLEVCADGSSRRRSAAHGIIPSRVQRSSKGN